MRMLRYAFCLLILSSAQSVFGQETFDYEGPAGSQTWELDANWSDESGLFSTWPGEAPDTGTLDSVNLISPGNLDLQINTPGLKVDNLTLGGATPLLQTTVSGAPGATLTANSITSGGALASLNDIAVDLAVEGDMVFDGAAIEVTGQILNVDPTSSVRVIDSNVNGILSIDGNIKLTHLSNPAAPNPESGHLKFINTGGTSTTQINGAISDGDVAGGMVTYAKGDFVYNSDSTYTGDTRLGDNHPNVGSTHTIKTNSPFGTGELVFYGGNSVKTLTTAFTSPDITLANTSLQLSADAEFAGIHSITLNGFSYQSNSRKLVNNISTSSELTLNGNIFASDSTDVREWVFDGSGTTIVTGIIDDSLNNPGVTGAMVGKNGSGRTILTNPNVAAYTGFTRVRNGVLQLGDGGAAVDLNDDVVDGDGTLEINHSGTLTFSPEIGGNLTVIHNGSGTTTLDRNSTGNGNFEVSNGTLLVTAGNGTTTSATGSGNVLVDGGTLGGTGGISGVVTVNSGSTLAPGTSPGKLTVGELTMNAGSIFEMELAGDGGVAGTDFDQLAILGNAAINDAVINVSLTGGYTPNFGDSFQLFDFGGTVSGTGFSAVNLPALGTGLYWDDSTLFSSGILTVAGVVDPEDLNGDGYVDSLDLGILLGNWGQNVTPDQGELDGMQPVDGLDLGILLAAWNPPPLATATSVPEPSATLLLTFGLIPLMKIRRF